jgi:hypothetical protein
MTEKTFKFDTPVNLDQEKLKDLKANENVLFSFAIPIEYFVKLHDYINSKIKSGETNYTLKRAILDGLIILKLEFPDISNKQIGERRFYRGGNQKLNKLTSKKTSINLSLSNVIWIDNFISQERKKDFYFAKVDFFILLINKLKN